MGAEATKNQETEEDLNTQDGNQNQDDGSPGDDSSKAQGNTEQGKKQPQDSGDDDLEKWEPAKVKDYVKNLRKENKGYRQKAQALEEKVDRFESALKTALGVEGDDDVAPEDKIKNLTQMNEAKELRLAILESAIEHGVHGQEGVEYFEFLVNKRLSGLEEGQNLEDEDFAEIVEKVKQVHGGGGSPSKNTTFSESQTPNPGKPGEVTLEQFMKMTNMEKGEIFRTDEAHYNRLMQEARSKKLFV